MRGGGQLLVIDDGSKDDTFRILQALADEIPSLIPITKPNSGHGPTLLYGYKYALEHGADYVFQTDSDGQTLPEEFGKFWELRHTHDAIIGSRPNREDGRARKLVERVVCLMLRIIFGVKVPDANAPFRLMKAGLLKKYLHRIPEDFNIPNVLLTAYFSYFRENIKFVDITFRSRQGGSNSINLWKIFGIGCRALRDFVSLRRNINA